MDEEDEFDEEGNVYQTSSGNTQQMNKECTQDWSYYLLSITQSASDIDESQKNFQENQDFIIQTVFLDFLFLLFTYLFMFVVTGQLRLVKD